MLSIISLDEEEKWDKIVKGFKNYDVFYLSGYAKSFQIHGDGEPILFYYNDGSTKAINVAMKRDIAKTKTFEDKLLPNTWFDLSTPYGYGGFLFEGEGHDAVNAAYDKYCRDNGYVSEFVRFHLFSTYQPYYSGACETITHNVVRTLELSMDEILRDFEHKVRKNIKKASNIGLDFELDTTGTRLDEFLEIYYKTMNRTGAKENFFFSREFFKELNELEDNYVYFHTLYEGKVISTELVLYGNENCYSFLGGTNQDYFHFRPNDFLKYQIIKWAKEKGLKKFILGGGYGNDDGIFRYKKSLAPNGIYNFYIGKKIFDKEKYERLVKIRSKEDGFDKNASFFPVYRV